MYIKIDSGEKGANTGTVAPLVRYLEKEDRSAKPPRKPLFFDQHSQTIPSDKVTSAIDANTKKLTRKDEKYFMISICPSQRELQHIGGDAQKLIQYARVVMGHYAQGFQRNVTADDLLYFGKVEYTRPFRSTDAAVQQQHVPAGTPKPGLQLHVHIIVSRKDAQGQRKLSPNTNHKQNKGTFQGGFHRKGFFLAAEQAFDRLFAYPRAPHESLTYGRAVPPPEPLDPLVLPLQKALLKARADRPSVALYALRLHRAGITLRLGPAGVAYHVAPRALPLPQPKALPAELDTQQTEHLLARGYTDLLEEREQQVACRGQLLLVKNKAGHTAVSFLLQRHVPTVFAGRPLSAAEQAQLCQRGYTAPLTGFYSRAGRPFTGRLYFDAHNVLHLSFGEAHAPLCPPLTKADDAAAARFVFPKTYMDVTLTPQLCAQLRSPARESEVLEKIVYRYPLADHLHLDAWGKVQHGLPVQLEAGYVVHERALSPAAKLDYSEADTEAVQAALQREAEATAADKALITAVMGRDYAAIGKALQAGASPTLFSAEEYALFPKTLQQALEKPPQTSARHATPTFWQGLRSFFRTTAATPPVPPLDERRKKKRKKNLDPNLN